MTGVDVVIPVYKPDHRLKELLKELERQTVVPDKVIIMNTGREFFDGQDYTFGGDMEVVHITPPEFDHGGTRHEGICLSNSDYVLLMTQDAVPADEYMVEQLLDAFREKNIAVAYARQLPSGDCRVIERLAREFNYPDKSRVKDRSSISTMGIKAFFCSDVCAMYDRKIYLKSGGFIRHTIFNEDMIMAHRFLMEGYGVYYKAEAKVIHSHNYTNMQQFRRNFDLGVSQADHPEVFSSVSSESEGIKYIKRMTARLAKEGALMYIPYFYVNSAFRLVGYKLGRNYRKLPLWLVRRCTMSANYWRNM